MSKTGYEFIKFSTNLLKKQENNPLGLLVIWLEDNVSSVGRYILGFICYFLTNLIFVPQTSNTKLLYCSIFLS